MTLRTLIAAACGGSAIIAACPAAVAAGPVQAIFTNLPGHPTSLVPGLSGLAFNPGISTQFDRPFVSPDGRRWILRARLAPPADNSNNEVILLGSGPAGSAVVREGTPTGFLAGEVLSTIQRSMGVNDAGQIVFACSTNAPAPMGMIVVRRTGDVPSLVARSGEPAPSTGGGRFGPTLDSAGVLADGTPYFRAVGIVQGELAGQSIWYRGGQAVAATLDPAFEPLDQLNDPAAPWESLGVDTFRMDATGQNWIGAGSLLPPVSSQLLALNNRVVAQQGTVIPGDPLGRPVAALGAPAAPALSADGGVWMARGTFMGNQDFVLRGGAVVAATDDPITLRPGETEFFDDTLYAPTFFMNAVNGRGDSVIGGVTDRPLAGSDAVLVFNRQRVVVREGDPVDLNRNGLPDDDAFIGVLNDDDAFLTDDHWLYFTADLRDVEGSLTGQGFLRLKICKPDWDVSGGVNSADVSEFLIQWLGGIASGNPLVDYDHSGTVNSADISAFLGDWLAAVTGGC